MNPIFIATVGALCCLGAAASLVIQLLRKAKKQVVVRIVRVTGEIGAKRKVDGHGEDVLERVVAPLGLRLDRASPMVRFGTSLAVPD